MYPELGPVVTPHHKQSTIIRHSRQPGINLFFLYRYFDIRISDFRGAVVSVSSFIRGRRKKMYKKIMVPLDGSELAECVLPHVEAFIKGFNISDVILVRVVEPETLPYRMEGAVDPEIVAQREAERKSSAKDYLNGIAKRFEQEGTVVHPEVLIGRVTESLADYAVQNDVDLFVIATHGRSGVSRWVMGSVADKLLRSASMPVLMVRAPGAKGGM
jgi:nucleotide-binding universal stress UspA family protein